MTEHSLECSDISIFLIEGKTKRKPAKKIVKIYAIYDQVWLKFLNIWHQ